MLPPAVGGISSKTFPLLPPLFGSTYNIPGKRLLDTHLLLILRHVFGGKLLLELHWVSTQFEILLAVAAKHKHRNRA